MADAGEGVTSSDQINDGTVVVRKVVDRQARPGTVRSAVTFTMRPAAAVIGSAEAFVAGLRRSSCLRRRRDCARLRAVPEAG